MHLRYGLLTVLISYLMVVPAAVQAAEPSVADLVATLKSGDESARLMAIDYLGRKGEQAAEAVPALARALDDESALVRAHAAEALGKIGPSALPAVPKLIQRIADENASVRRKAVMALREIRPGARIALEPLVKLLADVDPGVRQRVLQTLAEGGKVVVPGLIAALENEKAAYWALLVLRDIGPDAQEAVPALTGLIADKRPEIRREAILALAEIGEASAPAAPQLAKALEDPVTAAAATYALGRIGKAAAETAALIRANVESPDKVLAIASIWALVKLQPTDEPLKKKAADTLAAGLTSEDRRVRLAAAKALLDLKLGPALVGPAIAKALEGASEEVMIDAMQAIAALGAPAVPRLVDALKNEKLRAAAVYVLGEIGPEAKDAVGPLQKLLDDPDPEVRSEAAMALGKIGPEAKTAVSALIALLEKPDESGAYAAAFALGHIGPAAIDAKPALLKAMQGDDESVSLIAAWSLMQVQPDCRECVEKGVPILVRALGDPSPRYRIEAAMALEAMGPLAKEAIPALEKAAKDPNARVRKAAQAALGAVKAVR